jgi:hypothetical protein
MITNSSNSLIPALQTQEMLALKSREESSSCLFDSQGVYVKVDQITQNWFSQEKQICISDDKKISFILKVCRKQHAFGNIPLADEIKLLVKVEKVFERKTLFGWQDSKKETKANRGFHEERINHELREYIQTIVRHNCSVVSKIISPVDSMRFPCDENGRIAENGKYAFNFEQHIFKPLGMSEMMSFYGWSTDNKDTSAAAFLRFAAISETLTEFAKQHHQVIFCRVFEENERIGLSLKLAAETHPTKLYGISPRSV